jgi:hypothetical protein
MFGESGHNFDAQWKFKYSKTVIEPRKIALYWAPRPSLANLSIHQSRNVSQSPVEWYMATLHACKDLISKSVSVSPDGICLCVVVQIHGSTRCFREVTVVNHVMDGITTEVNAVLGWVLVGQGDIALGIMKCCHGGCFGSKIAKVDSFGGGVGWWSIVCPHVEVLDLKDTVGRLVADGVQDMKVALSGNLGMDM